MVDKFINKIDYLKFKSTNDLWNKLGLNTSWSVGCVALIIKQKKLKCKEDWYKFYFKSGETRLRKIKKLPQRDQDILMSLHRPNFCYDKKYLNENFGRTKSEIGYRGDILYKALVKEGNTNNLTINECRYIAYFRTVCETWNGIMVREKNTKETIEDYFQDKGYPITLIDTLGQFDSNFAIDFELYYNGTIYCGLQIKPNSYNGSKASDTKYINDAKKLNNIKNNNYTNKYGRAVYYIFSDHSGKISNPEVLPKILNSIKLSSNAS